MSIAMNTDLTDKNQQLYKTELCRNWQEMGQCRYGRKCCFAHGIKDLKMIQRHSRYKTRICRTYHLTGTCLYGVRCTFIHQDLYPSIPLPSSACLDLNTTTQDNIDSSSSRPMSTNNSPSYTNTLLITTSIKSPAPSPSPSVSTTTFSSSSPSSLSSSPILSSSSHHTRLSVEKEGMADYQIPQIYRPSTNLTSSWLATTNPGFSSIWLTTSHLCNYHQPVTTKNDQHGGNSSSFPDW